MRRRNNNDRNNNTQGQNGSTDQGKSRKGRVVNIVTGRVRGTVRQYDDYHDDIDFR